MLKFIWFVLFVAAIAAGMWPVLLIAGLLVLIVKGLREVPTNG